SGGFDENMIGHGGVDAEYSCTLIEMGYLAMYSEKVIGWHIWHPLNQKSREESVKKNIKYLEKKHDFDKLSLATIQEKYFAIHKDGTFLMNPVNRLFRQQIKKNGRE
ncbi:unnamed protein product, partial [marine sediment metagenome]